MKILKLLLSVAFLHVANAAFATGASVPSASASGSGAGTAVTNVIGSNGTYAYNVSSGSTGSISTPSGVDDVATVVVGSAAGYNASYAASATVVIPTGETGTVSYSISRGTYATASLTVGSTSISTAGSGTITLSPGTYNLYTNASAGTNGGGSAQIVVKIAYDE